MFKKNKKNQSSKDFQKELILQNMALNAAANGIVITDKDGIMEWVNPAFTKLTGYTSAEAIGKHTRILKSNQQEPAFYKTLWTTIMSGRVWKGTLINKRKDGSLYREEQTITPLKDKDNKIINFVAIKQDITSKYELERTSEEARLKSKAKLEQKNAELESSKKELLKLMKELEQSKNNIELEKIKDDEILASAHIGLFAVDKNNKFMFANKKAEEIMGINSIELKNSDSPGDVQLENVNGEMIPVNKRPTYQAIKYGKTLIESSFVIVQKNGKKIPISLTVTPVRNNNDEIIGAIDVFRDITKELEVDRVKSEFISVASHQLRTPLGIIKWYIEAIYNSNELKDLNPKLKEYLDEIYRSNERLLELVKNLLLISRIDQGRIKDEPQSTDITKIIETVIKDLEILAKKHSVTMKMVVKDSIPKIKIDSLRFMEVVENLVVNAIRYNVPNGKLDIIVTKKKNNITLAFYDTGIGISNDDKKKIFTKFFRSEKASLANPEGTGLGLYVVKSYLTEWGGDITVESTENKGTLFIINLPLSPKKIKADN